MVWNLTKLLDVEFAPNKDWKTVNLPPIFKSRVIKAFSYTFEFFWIIALSPTLKLLDVKIPPKAVNEFRALRFPEV